LEILSEREVEPLIAHEFAHHVLGHLSSKLFRLVIAASKLRSAKIRRYIQRKVVGLARKRKENEFDADSYAAKYYPSHALGSALVLLDLSWEAYWSFERTGLCFGQSIDSQPNCETVDEFDVERLKYHKIKKAMFENPDFIELASVKALESQEDSDEYPCVQSRLERLGLNWESVVQRIHASRCNLRG